MMKRATNCLTSMAKKNRSFTKKKDLAWCLGFHDGTDFGVFLDFKRHKFWGHEPGKASEGSVFYTVFEPRGLNISLCDAWCMAEWKRENVKSHIPKNKNVQGFGVLEMGRCREAASLWHLVAACLLVYGGWSCRNVLGFQDPLTYVRLKGFPRSNILQYYSG